MWKESEMKGIPLEEVSSPSAAMETTKAGGSSTRDKSTRTGNPGYLCGSSTPLFFPSKVKFSVSVGVEVVREQNAKVSAFKFPNKLSRESVVLTVVRLYLIFAMLTFV